MNDVKFSIVVPIYNVDCYLQKCIDSILDQTYHNFELILVDDGSTDNCPKMCDSYALKDKRIFVIHKENGGLVSARKAGIKVANGDYAICVDSDDWIASNHLYELSKIINEYQPDIVCFNHYKVNDGVTPICNTILYKDGLYTKENIHKEIFPSLIRTVTGSAFPPTIWAKAYRMDLYKKEQLSVDDRIKIGEDSACTIPCVVRAESLFILDKPLYYYRKNNISMTKNKKPFSWDVPELIEKHLRARVCVREHEMHEQISRRTVHALINVTKTQFYRNEPYRTITKDIKEQLKRPIYFTAIRNSKFKRFTPIHLCSFFLKKHIFFPFWVLSKLK